MPRSFRTWGFAVILALCLPRAAFAFWPLDRNNRVVTDSLSTDQWRSRFETWKQRPLGDSAATGDPLKSVRRAAEAGKIDPSLVARLAKEAQEGKLPGTLAPGTRPPGASPTAPGAPPATAQATTTSPDTTAGEGLFPQVPPSVSEGAGKASGSTSPSTATGGTTGAEPSDTTATSPNAGGTTSALGPDAFASGDSLSGSLAGAFSDSLDSFGNPVSTPGSPAPGPLSGTNPPSVSSTLLLDRGFAPSLRAGLTSNNDRMRLDTSLSTSFSDASGIALSANLTHNQELRLSQGSENESNGLTMALTAPIRRVGLSFGLSAGGNRRSSLGARNVTTARTSDRSENRLAQFSANFARPIRRGFNFSAYYGRNFNADEQTIAATSSSDQGERSTQTTGNSFGVAANIDRLQWIKLRGSFGRSMDNRRFRSPSFITENHPSDEAEAPSDGDTVTVRAEMPIGRYVPQLTAEFQVRRSEYSYTDVTRTSSGGIQSATNFAVETETRFSRTFRLQGSLQPLRFLSGDFSYEVARDSVSAVLRTTLFEDSKRQRWSLGGTLRTPWKGDVRLKYSGTKNDINKDVATNPDNPDDRDNPQTRLDKSHEISAEYLQNFTKTLKVRAYGSVSLAQGFYAHEGPQGIGDRDDSRAQLGLDLDGRISEKATASVQMYVRSFDQAFIDNRRSKDSRNEREYVVRQSFNYQITPRVLLRQFYGLSSKVVDEIFDPNGDTLNRNHFLQTSMNYKMTARLTVDARLDYRLQDNGLYIQPNPRSTERAFAPTARTKTNEVALAMRYALIRNNKLNFISDQVATREYRTNFFSGRPTGTTVTNRGNLGLGLESKITLKDLSLDASVRRNQSFNVSLNRSVYYDVRSSLSYTF